MGRFYLDLEFTNGNVYIGDIIEIGLVAEDTANVFHYPLPSAIRRLTNISSSKMQCTHFLNLSKKNSYKVVTSYNHCTWWLLS